MSDTIAVLGGTGALGRALALRLARVGHPVVLGSRDAARAQASAAELREVLAAAGADARVDGAANEDAAAAGEIVLLATPWDESGASIAALAPALAGRLVVSCINPLGFDATGPHGLAVAEGSAAEQVAALLPASTVAAAFHHLSAPSVADLDRDLSGEDVLVCGDDAAARARVVELAAAVTGRPGVDVGALRQAGVLEPFTAVIIAVNKKYKTRAGVLMTHVDPTPGPRVSGESLTLAPAPRSEAAEAVRLEVRQFLAEELAAGSFTSHVDTWLSGVDPAFSKKLGERGWLGMTWPKEYGGHERTAMERYAVTEELLAAGAPVAAHWIADRQSGPNLLRYGTEAQRAEILPRIAAGECFFVIGMSEPDSGSDLASIRTKATRDANGDWVVSGAKVWTSNAHHSHYGIVLVRTSPADPANRHAGLSQLLIDLSLPGITINPIRILDGGHHFNEVVFDDVVVPGDMLLGEEGGGWHQVTAELAFERSGPERFLSTYPLMAEFGRRAAATGDAAQLAALGRLSARLLALRQLSLRIAAALDRGELPNIAAALVKDVGTTFEADVVDEVRRVVDVPASLDSPDPLGRALAEAQLHAPGYTLRGGTNEILRGIVARGLGLR